MEEPIQQPNAQGDVGLTRFSSIFAILTTLASIGVQVYFWNRLQESNQVELTRTRKQLGFFKVADMAASEVKSQRMFAARSAALAFVAEIQAGDYDAARDEFSVVLSAVDDPSAEVYNTAIESFGIVCNQLGVDSNQLDRENQQKLTRLLNDCLVSSLVTDRYQFNSFLSSASPTNKRIPPLIVADEIGIIKEVTLNQLIEYRPFGRSPDGAKDEVQSNIHFQKALNCSLLIKSILGVISARGRYPSNIDFSGCLICNTDLSMFPKEKILCGEGATFVFVKFSQSDSGESSSGEELQSSKELLVDDDVFIGCQLGGQRLRSLKTRIKNGRLPVEEAGISNTEFIACDMKHVDFNQQRLSNCNFSMSVCQDINVEKAEFVECKFQDCAISESMLKAASLCSGVKGATMEMNLRQQMQKRLDVVE